MKKNIFFFAGAVLMLIALVMASLACAGAPAEKPGAKPQEPSTFEVVALDVKPAEVAIGQEATVTARIANLGKAQGGYTAVLTVNGTEVEKKGVSIAPESTQTVTFKIARDAAGTYAVKVGGMSQSLVVKKLVAKEVELKYDDGMARAYVASCGGYLVDFTPPAAALTVKKVRISGQIGGQPKAPNFEVEIWDKDNKVLHSAQYPIDKFPTQRAAWVEIEIPNIETKGKFYVHVYTGTCRMEGIHIGADDSVPNEHSTVTFREGGSIKERDWASIFPPEQWFSDKSKVNWMIRVVGTAMVPE